MSKLLFCIWLGPVHKCATEISKYNFLQFCFNQLEVQGSFTPYACVSMSIRMHASKRIPFESENADQRTKNVACRPFLPNAP